jgi:hypothetical protein
VVTHWDPSVRPDLLLEPRVDPRASHDLDLTVALLEDLGWTPFACGNGVREGNEGCDEGSDNGDGGGCLADCTLPTMPDDAGAIADATTADAGAKEAGPSDARSCAEGCRDVASPAERDADVEPAPADGAANEAGSPRPGSAERSSGCGCRVLASAPPAFPAWSAVAVMLAALRRRRRPRTLC